MADTYTPLLNLTLPEPGASRDTWGQKCNQNFATLDSYVGYGMPIGMLADFAGTTPPKGWLICDGRLVSRVTYAALFAIIGTLFGTGDGSTTFALPSLNGRSTIGPGSVTDAANITTAFTFAQIAGYVSNVITQANIPAYTLISNTIAAHNHGGATAPGANHTHSTDAQGAHAHGGGTSAPGDHSHTGYTDAQGNHSHNVAGWNFASGAAGSFQVPYPPSGVGYNGQYTDTQGNHQHNIQTYAAGNHTHTISTDTQGTHAHNITYSGNLQLGINADGAHAHSIASGGSGTALMVLGPILVVTKMIFAGPQGFTSAVAETAPLTIDATAEDYTDVDALRAEVAQLRETMAAFLPLMQRRVMSSPLRGSG